MAKEQHASKRVVDRLASWQRKLRFLSGIVPARQLPLLTPVKPHGPDVERFRDPAQTLVSWRDKQSQWWSFSGHLTTSRGRPLGFELSFFDRRMQNDFFGPMPARWVTPRFFAANFSLSDPKNADPSQTYRYWQRGGLLKSATDGKGFAAEDAFHVEVGGWFVYSRNNDEGPLGTISLFANADGDSVHLELKPEKPMVYHGQSGYAERGSDRHNTSFYCSLPRLTATGRILLDGALEEVTGVVWMDHEKFTVDESFFKRPWERLVIQLASGHDVMIYSSGGTRFGSWIDPGGQVKHLIRDDIELVAQEYWTSPLTGARYPIKQHLEIPSLGLRLDLKASIAAQERNATRTTLAAYWTGTVSLSGTQEGLVVDGWASLVAAGYDQRPRTRLLEFLVSK